MHDHSSAAGKKQLWASCICNRYLDKLAEVLIQKWGYFCRFLADKSGLISALSAYDSPLLPRSEGGGLVGWVIMRGRMCENQTESGQLTMPGRIPPLS